MISDLHRELVARAALDGWHPSSRSWKDGFARRLKLRPWDDERELILDDLRGYRLLPDAWRIRVGRHNPFYDALLFLEFLEVEISHPVSERKLMLYADLWETFDCSGRYELVVQRMDRYGVIRPLMDLDRYLEWKHAHPHDWMFT